MRWLALIVTLALAVRPAAAEQSPADAAALASQMLEQAAVALSEADSARDRVRALTVTVQAFEAGLAAMRDGLRRAAMREAELITRLHAHEGEVSQLIGVLQTMESAPPPVLLLHPSGPLGVARSGMMLAEVTPGLNGKVQKLAADLDEVRILREVQQNAKSTLEEGLAGVQQARAALSKAIADRTDLPKRFTEDPVRTAILISSTETLDAFASGLAEIAGDGVAGTSADVSALRGQLALPVQGVLLRAAGQADSAGVKRPGIILATRSKALVTTPTAATIRYRGPLLDLGNVIILEPQPDLLVVLSGLAEVFGEAGQVIPKDTPVGLMGGASPEIGAIMSTSGDGTGTERPETLYIEVREGGSPVDPQSWFRTDKDG